MQLWGNVVLHYSLRDQSHRTQERTPMDHRCPWHGGAEGERAGLEYDSSIPRKKTLRRRVLTLSAKVCYDTMGSL